MRFQRTVTYEIEAPSLDGAREVWAASGPEIETSAPIEQVEVGELSPFPADPVAHATPLDPLDTRQGRLDPESTYAGTLQTTVSVALDQADDPIRTYHNLAHLILSATDRPLDEVTVEDTSETHVAYFTSTLAIDFDGTSESPEDALETYLVDHDIMPSYELIRVEPS